MKTIILAGFLFISISLNAQTRKVYLSSEKIELIKNTSGVSILSFIAEEKAVLNGALQTIVSIKGVDAQYTSINKISVPNHIQG